MRLGVLIIGTGNIAGGFDAARGDDWPLTHAGAFTRHGGFTLDACVDPDAGRREAFQDRWGVATAAASTDALSGRRFDVVSICSPTACHPADLAAALAFRPRLVFCEKPLAPTLAEAREMVRQCADAGVLLAVNHTRRWAPDVVALRDELATGRWGALRAVVGHYNKGILNNGGHMVDLLHLLLGPVYVEAVGAAVHDFWPDDPTVPATLRTRDGVPVSLSTAHAADYAFFELQLVAARGVVAMEDGGAAWRVRHSIDSPLFRGYKALDAGERRTGEYRLAMAAAAANLHDAVTSGRPLASTGETALQAQAVCDAIRTAARPAATGPDR